MSGAPRGALTAALVVGLVVGVAGCSADEAGPTPPSSATPTATAPVAPPDAATGTVATTAPEASTGPDAPADPGGAPEPSPPGPGGEDAGPRPTAAVTTLAPVPAGEDAALSDGIVVQVRSVEEQEVTATAPGDVSGPAAVVRLLARNEGSAAAELAGLAVTASVGGVPAPPLSVETENLLTGTLAPGARAEGVYVFGVGEGDVGDVVVAVSSGTSRTTVRLAS